MADKSEFIFSRRDPSVPVRGKGVALPPILNDKMLHIFQSEDKLLELAERWGSPLHILMPITMAENIFRYQKILKKHLSDHLIYYAIKCNKSNCFLDVAAKSHIGFDVSSSVEFTDAYSRAKTKEIIGTGPAKSAEFLSLLLESNCRISVDSLEELQAVLDLLKGQLAGLHARLLLRYRGKSHPCSRFGMSLEQLITCIQQANLNKGTLKVEGFHFHLNGYDVQHRLDAISDLIPLIDFCKCVGIEICVLDIGGGMPVQYINNNDYLQYLKSDSTENYFNKRKPPAFYPYGGACSQFDWLDGLLSAALRDGTICASYFNKNKITMCIEPGRSLLDQCGISIFKVARSKTFGEDQVLFVEGTSFSACETWFISEYLVDPICIKKSMKPYKPGIAALAGHSCLEEDMIAWRKIPFNELPQEGDLIAFVNTAAYQMDLLENEFHRYAKPVRLIADIDENWIEWKEE